MLELRDVRVVFDGFHALDGVDLTVPEGELRFLIGPNGAGKTTLIDVITGLTRPAAGTVTFDGHDLVGRKEHRIVRLGVGRTFQTSVVFEELSVVENLDLAACFRRPLWSLARRRKGVSQAVEEALARTGLEELADRSAGVLSHGQRQWLELGMLLAQRPRLLLLDEPVAGMSREERERTGELLDPDRRRPHGDRGGARHGVPAPSRLEGDGAARGQGARGGFGGAGQRRSAGAGGLSGEEAQRCCR